MRWFFPSWNGDFRLEKDGDGTVLIMVQPTSYELELLGRAGVLFQEKGWWKGERLWRTERNWLGKKKTQRVALAAPFTEVGPALTALLKEGEQTLTAIAFSNGRVETVTGTDTKSAKALKDKLGPYRAPPPEKEPKKKPEPEKPGGTIAKAAATVKRATMSCPECHVGAVGPATECLLAFLDEEQHADWRDHRYLVCYGGISGHAYVLAHRHTPLARRIGKICYDLDDGRVLHFHDSTVPPEEEVLAAKLMLEHHEPWLRNEAACAGVPGVRGGDVADTWGPSGRYTERLWNDNTFKNPFGDGGDGIADSMFTERIGAALRVLDRE